MKHRVSGTVFEAFLRSVALYPDHDFLCVLPETARAYDIQPRAFSYQQAGRQVADLAGRYRSAGLRHGHRVGLMLENKPAMFFHWLALNSLGVSVVPINSDWRAAELEYVIGHSEIAVAVVPVARQQDIKRAAAAAGREVVVTSELLPDLDSLAGAPLPGESLPDERSECALLYTSGTTGRPKGCVLTNEYYLWAGTWYSELGGLCKLAEGAERLLTPLPMTHMNAMAFSTMVMMLTGGCIIAVDRFHPKTWWESVRGSRATVVHYLGVMPAMLLGAEPSQADRDHSVRFGFGAGVSARLHAPFEDRFGFPLVEAWAMTETGAGAVVIANHEPRKVGTACFGRPSARVEFRIVTEQGEDASPGQHGELWVRSADATGRPDYGFFKEYLKDLMASREAWAGGYFHTGDIVFADEEGDLHFVDRKKNVIRRSGENISAVEVEGVILQHPKVASVGVAAVPDEVRGDEVMACVVPRSSLTADEQSTLARELVDFCLQRLAYFKAPGFVAFCTQLPLTPTEKIQRAKLGELAREKMGGPGTIDLREMKKRSPTAA